MQSNKKELERQYREGSISRREFLRLSGLLGLSLTGASYWLAGCAPAATQAPTQPAAPPTSAPPIATQAPAQPTAAPTSAPPTATQVSAQPTAAPTSVPPAATPQKLKIAVFHGGSINDQGWDMLHNNAMLAVKQKYPFVETEYVENQPYTAEGTRTLEQLATDGANIIFLTTEYADIMYAAAANHPNTLFLECNGHKAEGNVSWYYVEHWDPSYLIGMASGLMTKTGKLGYVGSFPYPSVYTSVNSFHLGAQAVKPDVQTSVVLVNSWFDPAAERQAAEALINNGADMLFGIMSTPTYLQVAGEKGVMAATWTVDSRKFAPNAYISSCLSDWVYYYTTAVQQYLDGTLKTSEPTLLPIGKGTDRDAWGDKVPDGVRSQVDAVRDQMLQSGLQVFKGPIYDNTGTLRIKDGETMDKMTLYTNWNWAVKGVTGMK